VAPFDYSCCSLQIVNSFSEAGILLLFCDSVISVTLQKYFKFNKFRFSFGQKNGNAWRSQNNHLAFLREARRAGITELALSPN